MFSSNKYEYTKIMKNMIPYHMLISSKVCNHMSYFTVVFISIHVTTLTVCSHMH